MANEVKPLDAQDATLHVEADVAKVFGQGSSRSLKLEKVTGHPGKQSRRISINFHVRREGSEETEPVAVRVSSRDARRLAKLFEQMADTADRIS